MTSRIKHLQHAELYPSTRVANTKSMTPNQLRFRASGFKGFNHIPLGPCSGFKAKLHDFYFSFSSFLFLFVFFLFFSFLEDYIGLLIWVKQTYHGLPTCLRPALQSERRYTISQLIGTIWCAVCELVKGGMFKVEHAGTSTDQKLNQTWNCSSIKVTYRASILQLKARAETQQKDHCLLLAKTYILNNPTQNKQAVNKAKTKQKVIDDTSNSNFFPQPKYNRVSIG